MKIIRSWKQEDIPTLETLFRSANGYLDVRCAPEEGPVPGSSRVSHLHVRVEMLEDPYRLQFVRVDVPDAQTTRLFADGVPYAMFSEDTVSRIQELDTQVGCSTRASVWQLPQGTLLVRFYRMASTEIPGLFLQRMQLESLTYEGILRIETEVDAGSSDGNRALKDVKASIEENEGLIVCRSRDIRVACRSAEGCSLPGGCTVGDGRISGVYEGRVHPGDKIRLNRLAVYADGVTFADPVETVRAMMTEARQLGGEELVRREHKKLAAWSRRMMPMLSAPAPLEDMLDFSVYQLARSVGLNRLDDVLRGAVLLTADQKQRCMNEFLAGAGQEAEYLTQDDEQSGKRMHSAHLIGAYAAMLGIAGVEADETHFSANPTMPEGWDGYVLPVLWQGRLIRISMSRCGAAAALLSGEPVEILWQGKALALGAGKPMGEPQA